MDKEVVTGFRAEGEKSRGCRHYGEPLPLERIGEHKNKKIPCRAVGIVSIV